jgi:hypothetical protein
MPRLSTTRKVAIVAFIGTLATFPALFGPAEQSGANSSVSPSSQGQGSSGSQGTSGSSSSSGGGSSQDSGNEDIQGVPLNVPSTPVASVAQCPTTPTWSAPLPSDATVSPPTLTTGGGATITVNGGSVTESAQGRCAYTVSTPGDPVTFVDFGSSYGAFNTVLGGAVWNSNSQACSFSTAGGTFFSAFAEIENTSGYCNTDSSGNWSTVAIVNSNLQAGPTATTNVFRSWTLSAVGGSPFFWTWRVCLEDPVGQHVNYFCGTGNLSPLF